MMTSDIVHKVIRNLLIKLAVFKVLYECIQMFERITAECIT
jgi:hypothetical protein